MPKKQEKAAPTPEPTNCNVLEDLRCPKCLSEEEFKIDGTATFEVTDDGTGDYMDVQWGEHSWMQCSACHYTATVTEFTLEDNNALDD